MTDDLADEAPHAGKATVRGECSCGMTFTVESEAHAALDVSLLLWRAHMDSTAPACRYLTDIAASG